MGAAIVISFYKNNTEKMLELSAGNGEISYIKEMIADISATEF